MTSKKTRSGPPSPEYGVLGETVGPGDLLVLNDVLDELFANLRDASALYLGGENGGRAGTVLALTAVWKFLMRFSPVVSEQLQVSLLNLASALIALDQNNVESILKPLPRNGRAPDSPARQAMVGYAVGAVRRLEFVGLSAPEAHRAVATTLSRQGIKPTRGRGQITERTIREWCARVAADTEGRTIAAVNAAPMLSEKWRSRLQSKPQAEARKFVLEALVSSVRRMQPGG
jgi:hypothetical protein